MLCSTITTVRPLLFAALTRLPMRSIMTGFTPPAGSSSITSDGSVIKMAASSSSFFWP
jgi:hypothetical protein